MVDNVNKPQVGGGAGQVSGQPTASQGSVNNLHTKVDGLIKTHRALLIGVAIVVVMVAVSIATHH